MSSPRQRKKARRRAERTMDEAFEALLAGKPTLAEKLARRAVAAGEINPRLWLDLGRILRELGDPRLGEDTEHALRRAIALAPDYGEAFAELAAFQAAAGKWPQAERLQRRAVELLPGDAGAARRLAKYTAELSAATAAETVESPAPAPAPTSRTPAAEPVEPAHLAENAPRRDRTERFPWLAIAAELRSTGTARLDQLLDQNECAALRAMWDRELFEHEETADDERGRYTARTFSAPLPEPVAELGAELYARLGPIADDWHRRLARRTPFPPTHAEFLQRCVAAGQHRPGACLVRFPAGGHRAPACPPAQRATFPFRIEIALGPGPAGALRLLDVRSSRRFRERTFERARGDALVFAAPERLVELAGVPAAQRVLTGTAEVLGPAGGAQLLLELPLHDIG